MYQKGNTMRQGFTLVELLCVLAIIAILTAALIPYVMNDRAHGMEIQKLLPTDDATVKTAIQLMKQDPHLTVTIMAYSAVWTTDTVDPVIDQARKVLSTLHDAGIYANRITMLFANKGGLVEDSTPTPEADGVYLYLE